MIGLGSNNKYGLCFPSVINTLNKDGMADNLFSFMPAFIEEGQGEENSQEGHH